MKNTSEPIIGYQVILGSNNTWMYGEDEKISPSCPICGYALDYFQHKPEYSTKQRIPGLVRHRFDIAHTLDHRIIITKKFRDFCCDSGYGNLEFLDFTNDPLHFQLKITQEIRIDRERSQIRFGRLCHICQRYDGVRGGREPWTEWRSKTGSLVYEIFDPIQDAVFRSDLSFGIPGKRMPNIIVGIETCQKLKESGLKGIHLQPAYGLEPGAEPLIPFYKNPKKYAPMPEEPITGPKFRPKRRRRNDN